MTRSDDLNLVVIEDSDLIGFPELNENFSIIEDAISDLQDSAESLPTMQQAIADNTTAIEATNQRITGQGSTISQIQSNLSNVSNELNLAEQHIDSLGNTIAAINTKVNNNKHSLTVDGAAVDNSFIKTLVFNNVQVEQIAGQVVSYGATFRIPKASLGANVNNFAVVSGVIYNEGSRGSFAEDTGFTLLNKYVEDTDIVIKFRSYEKAMGLDQLTAVLTIIAW